MVSLRFSFTQVNTMSTTPTALLTEDELAELDTFLNSSACDEDTLGVDEAHGYLTALSLSSENGELATGWQEEIWGQPRFADEAQRRHMHELLERLPLDIVDCLTRREPFDPLVIESEEDGVVVESYEGWCFGFMLGLEQQWEVWQGQPDDAQDLIIPIAQLALLMDEEGEEMSEEEYQQWVELIPGAVAGLFALRQH
jgi:uncharacterized protein